MRLPLPARFLRSTVAVLLLAFAPAGCGDIFGMEYSLICPDVALPAVRVQVEDADDGAPVELALVTGQVTGNVWDRRNVGFVDSARTHVRTTREGDTVALAGLAPEVPGVYEVTVEKDGFRQWRREDVWAREGECGVVTVDLTARLEPK